MTSEHEQQAGKAAPRRSLSIEVEGCVQGLGYRPYVYRLAAERGLCGWVRNDGGVVRIAVEGSPTHTESFVEALRHRPPTHARIDRVAVREEPLSFFEGFCIVPSAETGGGAGAVLPDIATCPDCLSDVLSPGNRRHRYPFTTCTLCGPRYTVMERLPYDREQTSMKTFRMCPLCEAEYRDPLDRRFHSQTNACPECGPQLSLVDRNGEVLASRDGALLAAAGVVQDGGILALEGMGGFQLFVDATNSEAVDLLRVRKRRPDRPLALMVPDLAAARVLCDVSVAEATLLQSPQAPIVLLRAHDVCPAPLAPGVAPGLRELGVMLPYTPLHHLVMRELRRPVVATSGNLSGEPICIDPGDARERLGAFADAFLVHDRPILRHADDSVARIVAGGVQLVRLARGYAPFALDVGAPLRGPVVALGGHMKASPAIGRGSRVWLGPHVGDLDDPLSMEAHRVTTAAMLTLHSLVPERIVHDAHPDYATTREAERRARETGLPAEGVQHHLAHVWSCMAEHGLSPPVLGASFDGTGYGLDGTVWGGELLVVEPGGWRRAGALRRFRLPGGERAIEEPRRTALGLLHELGVDIEDRRALPPALAAVFSDAELRVIRQMLARGVSSPVTSSVGRLFDGVSALLGICTRSSYEGQAAMLLEHAQSVDGETAPYEVPLCEAGSGFVLDFGPMLRAVLLDIAEPGVTTGAIARRVHGALARAVVAAARHVGIRDVVLTGGCFLNRTLLVEAVRGLSEAGHAPYWNRLVPTSDGGLAVGQILAADAGEGR